MVYLSPKQICIAYVLNSVRSLRLSTFLKGAATALCLSLAACVGGQQSTATVPVEVPKRVRLLSGDSEVLNYTPWYIENFSIFGPPGSGIGGGGPGALPVNENGRPSEGGGVCCTSVPAQWQPDLKLTVRWAVDKKMDGKTPGYWYKAENVRIAQYGEVNRIVTIFLPGDRVRFMITDGNREGGNNVNNRPADSDPYIVQGVLDVEWNKKYRRGGMQ